MSTTQAPPNYDLVISGTIAGLLKVRRSTVDQLSAAMSPDCSPACQQDRHGHCGGCVCGCHVFARLGMQPGWNG